MLLAPHGALAQAPSPPLDLRVSSSGTGDERIIVHARRPHFSTAPLPGHDPDGSGDPPDMDPESGAAIGEFGPAFGAAAAAPIINPAGNWPPPTRASDGRRDVARDRSPDPPWRGAQD